MPPFYHADPGGLFGVDRRFPLSGVACGFAAQKILGYPIIEHIQRMIIQNLLFILLCPFLLSCATDTENTISVNAIKYDTLEVKESLQNELIFRLMNEIDEPASAFSDQSDSIRRKASSTVQLMVIWDEKDRAGATDSNGLTCSAVLKEDTLRINVGHATGFGGSGVSIKVVGNQFTTIFYKYTDLILPVRKEPVILVEKQNLILQRAKYAIGDSIYGFVYLRSVDDKRMKQYAQGFFRTKIKSE